MPSSGCGSCDSGTLPQGPAGVDGLNAFTTTTASFSQPAVGSNVTIAVLASGQSSAAWAEVGQPIYIADSAGEGGQYEVVSLNSTVSITVKLVSNNSGTTTGTTINSGAKVSPSGRDGYGANGTTIIDTDVSDVTTTQSSFSAANKTVTIPADTWETVDDTVEFEGMFIADTADEVVRVQLSLGGNVLDLQGVWGATDYVTTGGAGAGYPSMRLKVKIVMSAAGSVTPIVDVVRCGSALSLYSVPQMLGDKIFYNEASRGAATTGLTFANSMDLVVKMMTVGGTNLKMFFSQVTVKKK